jgi:hypothetical protein
METIGVGVWSVSVFSGGGSGRACPLCQAPKPLKTRTTVYIYSVQKLNQLGDVLGLKGGIIGSKIEPFWGSLIVVWFKN